MNVYALMEEIINEVSMRKWKEAAQSSLQKRKEDAIKSEEANDRSWAAYDKEARKHPEEEPALYRLAQANDEAHKKTVDRADQAELVSSLKTKGKSANKTIKAAKKVQDKREDAFGRNPNARTLKRSVRANSVATADPVKSRTNEAFSLMEEILFELDLENKQSISPNKIKKTKKDENGEKVEVVSVADELFPYEGDAKQQFNQKILAKINDMIEGTGSLEDLIQFVRRGVGNKKVHEGYEGAINVLEDLYSVIKKKHGEPEYKGPTSEPANKSAELLFKMDSAKMKERKEAVKREKRPEETDIQATYRVLGKRDPLDTVKGKQDSIKKYKKSGHEGVNPSSLTEGKELNKECEYRKAKWEEANQKYFDTKKKHLDWEGKHPETKKAYDEERKAYANLDKARRDSKKINGPFEALEEIKNVAEGLFVKDNRGDLLDDIDTALGSPAKKKLSDIKSKMTGCKETKVHEALDLMEEIINEVSAGYVKKKAEAVIDKRKAEADHAYNFARKVHNYEVNKTGDNKNTPMTDKADNQSYEKGGRWSHAYLLSKYLPDSKKSIKPMVQAAKKVADTRSNHHWNDVEPTGTQEEIKKDL